MLVSVPNFFLFFVPNFFSFSFLRWTPPHCCICFLKADLSLERCPHFLHCPFQVNLLCILLVCADKLLCLWKHWLQSLHSNGLIFWCTFRWACKLSLYLNDFKHIWQENFLSSECTRWCDINNFYVEKFVLHSGHLNSFSSGCVSMWTFKRSFDVNVSEQNWHFKTVEQHIFCWCLFKWVVLINLWPHLWHLWGLMFSWTILTCRR